MTTADIRAAIEAYLLAFEEAERNQVTARAIAWIQYVNSLPANDGDVLADLYGIPSNYFDDFQEAIIPGTAGSVYP
jgi:hypothetical protein